MALIECACVVGCHRAGVLEYLTQVVATVNTSELPPDSSLPYQTVQQRLPRHQLVHVAGQWCTPWVAGAYRILQGPHSHSVATQCGSCAHTYQGLAQIASCLVPGVHSGPIPHDQQRRVPAQVACGSDCVATSIAGVDLETCRINENNFSQ